MAGKGLMYHISCFKEQLARIQRGDRGPEPTPLKNHKYIVFFSYTGPDLLVNQEATKPSFKLGQHRPASETPFK